MLRTTLVQWHPDKGSPWDKSFFLTTASWGQHRGLRYHFFRYRYDTDTMQVWIFDTDTILILFSYKISIPILILILFSYKISIPILILILPSNGLIPNLIPKFAWNCHFSTQKSMKSVLLIAFQGPWRDKVSTEFETCFRERRYWYWY